MANRAPCPRSSTRIAREGAAQSPGSRWRRWPRRGRTTTRFGIPVGSPHLSGVAGYADQRYRATAIAAVAATRSSAMIVSAPCSRACHLLRCSDAIAPVRTTGGCRNVLSGSIELCMDGAHHGHQDRKRDQCRHHPDGDGHAEPGTEPCRTEAIGIVTAEQVGSRQDGDGRGRKRQVEHAPFGPARSSTVRRLPRLPTRQVVATGS